MGNIIPKKLYEVADRVLFSYPVRCKRSIFVGVIATIPLPYKGPRRTSASGQIQQLSVRLTYRVHHCLGGKEFTHTYSAGLTH